jgi:hypothetical protein
MNFIDDATRFCYVYLCAKDEALEYFKIYKAEVEKRGLIMVESNSININKGE